MKLGSLKDVVGSGQNRHDPDVRRGA